jgi:hypothetical protein
MANSLPVSRLINVSVNLTPQAAQSQNLTNLLILGTSNVIDTVQRLRTYSTIGAVATDFGTTAPEYLAAVLWFEQQPQPTQLMIGRWAKTASSGALIGSVLSTSQQAIATWQAITNGGFTVTVDGGAAQNITGLNLSADTNLNGVASTINAVLTGASIAWNSTYNQFVITSNSTGAGTDASGTITLTGNPAVNDTVTIGGTTITFVAASPTGNQVLIGASANATATNLQVFLAASTDTNISKANYSVNAAVVTVTYKTVGTGGNAFTLAKSSTNITVSGATLTGGVNASSVSFLTAPGAGQDISGMLGMTATSSGAYQASGVAAETALSAVTLFDTNYGQQWYAVQVLGAADTDYTAISSYIEATTTKHFHAVSTQEAGVLTSTSTSDIAYELQQLGYNKTATQYSSGNAYAAASLMGRILTTDYTANNTAITLMYKQEPGITAENLTATQINALEAKNCNVFAAYNNSTAIIEPGVCASGQFIDTIIGCDNLAVSIQTAVWNLLYTSTTKIPQTDAGMHLIATTIEKVCAQFVTNGFLAPGTWNTGGFGTLNQGDFLPKGFYVYAPPVSKQSVSDRAARKSVTFQVAAKLAGAVHSVNIQVNVNQ